MSTLSQYGSGIKSIQTGFVGTNIISIGSGEAAIYVDITVSAVSNISKCLVVFNGSANNTGSVISSYYSFPSNSTFSWIIPTIRVLNSTTIRIMSSTSATAGFVGRWTLVEYN